jgi:uncharacterized protein (DUF2147 family)
MAMTFPNLAIMSAVAVSALVFAGTAHADPRGVWLARDGAWVRVSSCGKGICGTLAKTKSPVDPDTGKPWTDKNNPDPARRDRPLVGVEVFMSMMPDGPGKWSGHLYNTDGGQTVPGHILEVDHKTIRVEGCAGTLCGGQNMTRIR